MAPPSKVSIGSSSVQRLLKEEASYHKEMKQQAARIKNLEENPSGENAEYQLKQEKQGLEETKNVLPSLRKRITEAVTNLEQILNDESLTSAAPAEDVSKAKEVLAQVKTA